MHRLAFHYTLSRDAQPMPLRNALIEMLQAVASQGSISAAARALGLSYRHVWGELQRKTNWAMNCSSGIKANQLA